MKATFLIDLDVETDTDFLGVAEDLKDFINTNFPYACLAARPWHREAITLLGGTPLQTPGGAQPPNIKP